MSQINRNQLRDLLFRRAKAVSENVIQTEGEVAVEQLEILERLNRLVKVCDDAQPPAPQKRWPVAVVWFGTLLIVSMLLFARVAETEIELDVTLSEMSFVLARQQVLTDIMPLLSLGASGLREIRLPRAPGQSGRVLRPSGNEELAINISPKPEADQAGMLTLATLALPANTRVVVQTMEPPQQYRISLQGKELELHVGVNGLMQISLPGASVEHLDFSAPRSILLKSGAHQVNLDLAYPETLPPGKFFTPLVANDLAFSRIDEFTDTEHTVVRRVSTILSGRLYLEALNGKEYSLRPGEGIRFKASTGEIRTIALQDDHIALKFHGDVRGMSTGSEENRRSLMPTYLEWLRARHGLTLLWGTTLYLFGFIAGVLRWGRIWK
jgi:hypothetical protein